jgi:hypothetical protein
MKNMLTLFWRPISLVLLILMCATPAMANCDGLSVSGMTDSQIVTLKQKCVEMEAVAASPVTTAQDLSQYAELGKKYGIALSEVAKSVGTTVNELATTPVGIFMLIMVGWKVLGHDLLGVFGGFLWFMVMLPLWMHYFNKLVVKGHKTEEIFNETTGKLFKRINYPIDYENGTGAMAAVLIFMLIAICAAGFTMIF